MRAMPSSPGNCWSHVRSSPSPCPPSSAPQTPSNRRSMEEVWKEIELSSLYDFSNNAPSSTNNTGSAFRSSILHEFLDGQDGPLNKGSSAIASSACNPSSATESTFLGCPEQAAQATLLSLSSRPEFQKQGRDSCLSSFNTSFDALGSSTICPSNIKKRAHRDIYDSSDGRHTRMIKNRESAARSRARKQAYTFELELEVARLKEENSSLIRQVEKLQFCLTSSAKHPKKRTLYRTSTSSF